MKSPQTSVCGDFFFSGCSGFADCSAFLDSVYFDDSAGSAASDNSADCSSVIPP